MSTPPPIPERSSRPIQRAVFKEKLKVRLGNVTFDFNLMDAAMKKAEDWINANPGIEIEQIETFGSSTHGITVVWYR